ncbi:conserved hypothetical protein [Ricinus communis]|uniref:Uncharacterized protein n=1 Tax=Ricinus communis TaxID=3988 RepID=B9RU59_RICCO|nr:conserved hypothetical protein [Ricinus communis]
MEEIFDFIKNDSLMEGGDGSHGNLDAMNNEEGEDASISYVEEDAEDADSEKKNKVLSQE